MQTLPKKTTSIDACNAAFLQQERKEQLRAQPTNPIYLSYNLYYVKLNLPLSLLSSATSIHRWVAVTKTHEIKKTRQYPVGSFLWGYPLLVTF